jgi:hypothetical protein
VAKYARRRVRGKPDSFEPEGNAESEGSPTSDEPVDAAIVLDDEANAPDDWFGPDETGEVEGYLPQRDVPLAAMLMLGGQPWQRIDGMGLARKALEAEVTGDQRRDLSDGERFLLANGRAWCLLVHGDLGHQGRRDDPFVLSDAGRHLEMAQQTDPTNPAALTTLALLRLREADVEAALEAGRQAVEAFAALPDERRTGLTQASAVLALVTMGLVCAASGDTESAEVLVVAARATRSPLDLDEASFAALTGEIAERTGAG